MISIKASLAVIAISGLVIYLVPPSAPTDVEIVANHICMQAISVPEDYRKPGTRGEQKYLLRMQKCTAGWERLLSSDPVFLAKEKAAYSL